VALRADTSVEAELRHVPFAELRSQLNCLVAVDNPLSHRPKGIRSEQQPGERIRGRGCFRSPSGRYLVRDGAVGAFSVDLRCAWALMAAPCRHCHFCGLVQRGDGSQ